MRDLGIFLQLLEAFSNKSLTEIIDDAIADHMKGKTLLSYEQVYAPKVASGKAGTSLAKHMRKARQGKFVHMN